MTIGERVRELRKKKGWTQYRLAMESSVSRQAISNMERGRNEPNADSIRLLAVALGVSVSEILGEDVILEEHKLTPREYKMISEFRKLNPAGQKMMVDLAIFYQSKEEYRKGNGKK